MSDISRKIIKKLAETVLKSTNNKVVLFTKEVSELISKLAQTPASAGEEKQLAHFSQITRRSEYIRSELRYESKEDQENRIESGIQDSNPAKEEIASRNVESAESRDPNPDQKTKAVSVESINNRTSLILQSIKSSNSQTSLLKRLESLNLHLKQYPEGAPFASNNGALKLLINLKRDAKDVNITHVVNETLSVMGYCDTPPSTGIRILSIDGGGMRGLVVLNILQQLENLSGKKIHQLFDYICGVSTGAIIAFCSVPPIILPLEKLRELYLELGRQIFKQSALKGASKLVFSSAYYETSVWEKLLKDYVGTTTMLETTRYSECPKISVLSTVGSRLRVVPFLFRNYALPTKSISNYPGSCNYTVFEALRASSAAPSVFKEFRTESHSHLDGGIVANNPAGVAIHEVKALWPNENINCLVSCGTGRHPPEKEQSSSSSSWKRILDKVLESATDTEAVHQILNDLLSENVYHRFNPILSNSFAIDEVCEKKVALLEEDTADYCKKNHDKFKKVVNKLTESRSLFAKCSDHIKMQIKLSEYS